MIWTIKKRKKVMLKNIISNKNKILIKEVDLKTT